MLYDHRELLQILMFETLAVILKLINYLYVYYVNFLFQRVFTVFVHLKFPYDS